MQGIPSFPHPLWMEVAQGCGQVRAGPGLQRCQDGWRKNDRPVARDFLRAGSMRSRQDRQRGRRLHRCDIQVRIQRCHCYLVGLKARESFRPPNPRMAVPYCNRPTKLRQQPPHWVASMPALVAAAAIKFVVPQKNSPPPATTPTRTRSGRRRALPMSAAQRTRRRPVPAWLLPQWLRSIAAQNCGRRAALMATATAVPPTDGIQQAHAQAGQCPASDGQRHRNRWPHRACTDRDTQRHR